MRDVQDVDLVNLGDSENQNERFLLSGWGGLGGGGGGGRWGGFFFVSKGPEVKTKKIVVSTGGRRISEL